MLAATVFRLELDASNLNINRSLQVEKTLFIITIDFFCLDYNEMVEADNMAFSQLSPAL